MKQPENKNTNINANIFLEAYSSDSFSVSPEVAVFNICSSEISSIYKLKYLCNQHNIEECRMETGPQWGNENNLYLVDHQMVVNKNSLFFTAVGKHNNVRVHTHNVNINELLALLSKNGTADIFETYEDGKTLSFTDHLALRNQAIELNIVEDENACVQVCGEG
jgi:hypothetical protein